MATNGRANQEEPSRIPVAYLILGYENNRDAIVNFFRNAGTMVHWVTDAIQPEVSSKIEWLWKEASAARERGVKIQNITDITSYNLVHCKKLMSMIDELRHLEGIGVIFGVSDVEFVAMAPSLGPREERNIQLVYSDSESVVRYKQLIFDALWTRAAPAHSRIDELEGRMEHAAGEKSVAADAGNKTIDRIYVCKDCHQTFVYKDEVEDHKETQSHESFREYPVV